MRHPSPRQGVLRRTQASELPKFYTWLAFKIWLAAVSHMCPEPGKTVASLPDGASAIKKTAGFPPPFGFVLLLPGSAQQLQHALLRLVGQRQRGHRDRLPGRQRLAVGRFLVGVGQRQVRCAGLQHVDQVLVEVLADLARSTGSNRALDASERSVVLALRSAAPALRWPSCCRGSRYPRSGSKGRGRRR